MSACYKKCRDLTGGTHSKRAGATAAFSSALVPLTVVSCVPIGKGYE